MRILLTNDDGVDSPGIRALNDGLSALHEVWIVAPDRERSGCSHSITSFSPVITRKLEDRVFSCSGVPVDCVNVSLAGEILPGNPDLVLSGINLGPNLGTDILFSGTAAAARQATLRGVPAAALSIMSYEPPFHFAPVVEFVASNLVRILSAWSRHRFLNFNFPNAAESIRTVRLAAPAHVHYSGERSRFEAPRGETYHFTFGSMVTENAAPGSDLAVVLGGETAVTPIAVMPSAEGTLDVRDFAVPATDHETDR
jgi:5'-nucleotidase